MGYAFISYSSKQKPYLDKLRALLADQGIQTWAAPEDIPVGQRYSEVIKRAIEDASCVILLLTEDSQCSTYCTLEMSLALKTEKIIAPIQIDRVWLNETFASYLGEREIFRIPDMSKRAKDFRRAAKQLQLLCGEDAAQLPAQKTLAQRLRSVRKGTWLQLFGWLWVPLGFWLVFQLTKVTFFYANVPESGEWGYDALIRRDTMLQTFFSSLSAYMGLLCAIYGYSLNRIGTGKERNFFKLLTRPQIWLVLSGLCWIIGITFGVGTVCVDHPNPPLWWLPFAGGCLLSSIALLLAATIRVCVQWIKKLYRRSRIMKSK